MPPIFTDKSIHTGIHDFKTNISKYIRMLDNGQYEKLILMSRGKPIGVFGTFEGTRIYEKRSKLAQLASPKNGSLEALDDLINGLNGWGALFKLLKTLVFTFARMKFAGLVRLTGLLRFFRTPLF